MKLRKNPPLKHDETDFILHLIREELKIRKFFNILREVGLEECFYEPDLSFLILTSLGLNDGKDETYYHFSDLMDACSKKIKADQESLAKQAKKAYQMLVGRKES